MACSRSSSPDGCAVIPRATTRSLDLSSSAALRAFRVRVSRRVADRPPSRPAMVAGPTSTQGDPHGSDRHLHARRRWLLYRHHPDALARHQSALRPDRTLAEREGAGPARAGGQRRDRRSMEAALEGEHRVSLNSRCVAAHNGGVGSALSDFDAKSARACAQSRSLRSTAANASASPTMLRACMNPVLSTEPKLTHALIWSRPAASRGRCQYRAKACLVHCQRYMTPSEKHAPRALMAVSSAWGLIGLSTGPRSMRAIIFAPCPNLARAARGLSQLLECRQVGVEGWPDLLRHRDVPRLVQSARHAVRGRGRRHRRSRARLVQCIVSRIGRRAECRSSSRGFAFPWSCSRSTCNKRNANRDSVRAELIRGSP